MSDKINRLHILRYFSKQKIKTHIMICIVTLYISSEIKITVVTIARTIQTGNFHPCELDKTDKNIII